MTHDTGSIPPNDRPDDEPNDESQADQSAGPITPDVEADMKRWQAEWEEAKATGGQLGLGLESDQPDPIDYDDLDAIDDTQDPDESTALSVLVKQTVVKNLPRGERWKKLRDTIYEEQNIYLRRGRKKSEKKSGSIGANSQITYTRMQKRMQDVVRRWVENGASPIELYYALVDLNREAGYRPKAYDAPLKIQGTLDDVLRATVKDKPKPDDE